MPHITLEISSNLNHCIDQMLEVVTGICQQSGYFDAAVIMSRAVAYECFQVRQQGMSAFANVTLRVRPGRSEDIKSALAAQLADSLKQLLDKQKVLVRTCITCEIQEIDIRTRSLTFAGDS
ncbi:MAG TPA: hypothetical protein VIP51_07180 [Eoetvoesiella sp.]